MEHRNLKRAASLVLAAVMITSAVGPLALAVNSAGPGPDVTYTCGKEEHEHVDSCYAVDPNAGTWACEAEFGPEGPHGSQVVHVHDDLCYDPETGELTCYLAEHEAHVHGTGCYEQVPAQAPAQQDPVSESNGGLPEPSPEASAVPVPEASAGPGPGSLDWEDAPGTDDGLGDTDFDDEAPMQTGKLICNKQDTTEWTAHQHTEDCLAKRATMLVCGKEAHLHDETCIGTFATDEQVEHFCTQVREFVARAEAGEFDGKEDDFEAEYEAVKALAAGFACATDWQAQAIADAMAELDAVYVAMAGNGVMANYAAFVPAVAVLTANDEYAGSFTFTISGPEDDSVVMPDPAQATLSGAGEVLGQFAPIRFLRPGTYEFGIACTSVSGDFRRDERSWTLTVTVENRDGVLAASGTYRRDGSDVMSVEHAEFVNACTYQTGWDAATRLKARSVMDGMTLEEKVGQLFLLHYPGDGGGTAAQAQAMTDAYHPGGYLVFAAMFQNSTPEAVREKIASAQSGSGIPLLFTVDEEGGKSADGQRRILRISSYPQYGHDPFPSPQELKASGGLAAVLADSREKSLFLKALGLNVNHAPVADVAGPGGAVYNRTYGEDGLGNAGYVAAVIKGAAGTGVGTTMKHFPGYGGTSSDTHNGFAVNDLSLEDFLYNDLLPFQAGMAAGGQAVMVTHNTINCLDGTNPASLSPAVYGLLRDTMGFDGVAMTDDLMMGAITNYVGDGQASLRALQAGADMAMTGQPGKDVPVVLAAVRSGALSEADVDEKCMRILCWKIEMGLEMPDGSDPGPAGDADAEWTGPSGERETGGFDDMWARLAASGGTLALLRDVDVPGDRTLAGVSAKLDLNGHGLTFTSGQYGVNVGSGATFEVTDNRPGTVSSRPWSDADVAGYDAGASTLTYRTMGPSGDETANEVDLSGVGFVTGNVTGRLVRVVDGGTLVLSGGRLTGTSDGGVVVEKGTFDMSGGYVAGCSGSDGMAGGGVYLAVEGRMSMSGGCIGGNSAGGSGGGGVYLNGADKERDEAFRMTGGVIAANATTGTGGGVMACEGRRFEMAGGVLADNKATDGGGVCGRGLQRDAGSDVSTSGKGSHVHVSGNAVLTCNVASGYGGAASTSGNDGEFRTTGNVTMSGNKAAYGGAVGCSSEKYSGTVAVSGGTMKGNSASVDGGAVYIGKANADVGLSGVEISGNGASGTGGGLYMGNLVRYLTMEDCSFTGNSADMGGAMALMGGKAVLTGVEAMGNETRTEASGAAIGESGVTLTGEVHITGNAGGNVFLKKGQAVTVVDGFSEDSEVGVKLEAWPAAGELEAIAARSTDAGTTRPYVGCFICDDPAYGTGVQFGKIVVGDLATIGGLVNTTYDGMLFQYFANMPTPDVTGADDSKLVLVDTSGGNLPVNGNANTANERYMYVDADNKVAMHMVLCPMYAEVDYVAGEGMPELPDLQAMSRLDAKDLEYYYVQEIWVSDDPSDEDSVDGSRFRRYAYTGESYLTRDAADQDANAIPVGEHSIVRYVCTAKAGSYSVDTNFYDYDVTSGEWYATLSDMENGTNGKATSTQAADKTVYANVARKGINAQANYGIVTSGLLGFGNGESVIPTGLGGMTSPAGWNINAAENRSFNGCSFGLVTGLDADGNLVYADGVTAPDLFNEGDAEGKTYVPGHALEFGRVGDTYTLKSVSGTDLSDLDTFWSRWNWNKTKRIWSNLFWPMDWAPSWGADGHDVKFGSVANKANRVVNGGKTLPESDDGPDHNGYFGMNFQLTFTLSEDYVAPLSYIFFGDDDMWVFLDGQLICDIGGVHSACGEYVNLRDYLPNGTSGTHTLQFFYTERGASGSCCWMQFQLPHPLAVTTETPPGETPERGTVEITKTVSNTEDLAGLKDEFNIEVTLLDADGTALKDAYVCSGGSTGLVRSGDVIKLGPEETVSIARLPVGTQVRIREIMTDQQKRFWTEDEASGIYACTADSGTQRVKVHNVYDPKYIGPVLPNTGGPGTTWLYVVAGWCVAAASGYGLSRLNRKERRA